MKTDTLTNPSQDLKQHVQDLNRDAKNIAQDLKNQAAASISGVTQEASARLQAVKGTATEFYNSLREFAAQHPLKIFGIGVPTGFLMATWRRR